MLTKHQHNNLIWIDLKSPTREEVDTLMEEYRIHPLVAQELLSPTLRGRVDVYDDFIYLIFHFPTILHTPDSEAEQEIDFIVGKDFVITAHYKTVDALNEFRKHLEVNHSIKKEGDTLHAGFLFFSILRHLYRNTEDDLDAITALLTKIEMQIFQGKERAMVKEISRMSRYLLDFKKAIRPHQGIFNSFEEAGKKIFGKEFSYYLHAISGEYYRISAMLESNIETLSELRTTNDSLLSTKTNDIMKILTIMAFITFPLSLFASIFGMNTKNFPIIGHPNDFWIIISIMFVATICFFVFFKYKKWL